MSLLTAFSVLEQKTEGLHRLPILHRTTYCFSVIKSVLQMDLESGQEDATTLLRIVISSITTATVLSLRPLVIVGPVEFPSIRMCGLTPTKACTTLFPITSSPGK